MYEAYRENMSAVSHAYTVTYEKIKTRKHPLTFSDLNCLPQTHVISQYSSSVGDVVTVEKPHAVPLVVTQVTVDGGRDLGGITHSNDY